MRLPRHLERLRRKHVPFRTHIAPYSGCNLRCSYCYPYYVKSWKSPSWKEIKMQIDDLERRGCVFLDISGGEPLMSKDFFKVVDYAQSKHFAIILETNGTLITPPIADKIARRKFWEVIIGLSAADPETHDEITGVKGSFKRAIAAFKLLRRRGVRLSLQAAVPRGNGRLAQELRSLAKKIECKIEIYPRNTKAKIREILKRCLKTNPEIRKILKKV